MAKMDPGAPIAGALLRMDEWPPDCDAEGNPLPTNVRVLTEPRSFTHPGSAALQCWSELADVPSAAIDWSANVAVAYSIECCSTYVHAFRRLRCQSAAVHDILGHAAKK